MRLVEMLYQYVDSSMLDGLFLRIIHLLVMPRDSTVQATAAHLTDHLIDRLVVSRVGGLHPFVDASALAVVHG